MRYARGRFLVAWVLSFAGAGFAAWTQGLPAFPLTVDRAESAADRRAAKAPVETRVLDDMERPDRWTVFGPGRMTFTEENVFAGRKAVRLTSPTKLDKPGPVEGRPFAETGVRRVFDHEDWSRYNRVSFRVYPHLPGFHAISLLVKLRAEGSERWSYTFGQMHHVLLDGDRWNEVVWEIPHLPRTNILGIDLIYRLQGNEPGATDTVRFDFDDLRLERVEGPDAFRGWEVPTGTVAYSHLGYLPAAAKRAVVPAGVGTFEVVRADGQEVAFRGVAGAITNALGAFAELDFGELRQPGRYELRTGQRTTRPFVIGEEAWASAWVATLNQYACQRCGVAVPGIHGVCHQDWQVVHGERRLPIAGGWHDAGDLSQGVVNTSDAVLALFGAAEVLAGGSRDGGAGERRARVAELPARVEAEARWGLDWLLRTRFDDGYRVTWATMDFWTDGVRGNADDVTAKAGDAPFDVLHATAAEARAARWLRASSPDTAARALAVAKADWGRVERKLKSPGTELAAAAVVTALELHAAAPEPGLRDRAVELGRIVLAAQETASHAEWTVPLTGYFHTGPDRRRILRYQHRGHDEAPVVALAGLARAFPDHAEAPAWREAVKLHTRYLARTAALNAPWRLPAAGIYTLHDADPAQQRQIRQGLRLDDDHYLRRFPVWGDFRGNSGVLLSQARAWSLAARWSGDRELAELARGVVEWHLGRNPFGQSLLYGVGHDYTPQYTAMSGDIVGGMPVGIQTRLDEDVPYWPVANCYNFAEIWIHPSTRLLEILSDLEAMEAESPRDTGRP